MASDSLNGSVTMGVPQTAEGVDVPAWRQWLSRTRCQARMSVNARRFDKLVTEGDLPQPLKCPDGTQRWDAAVIDAFVEALEGKVDGSDDTKTAVDLSKASAQQVSVSTNHAERLIALLERPIKDAMANLRATNMDLRDENESLRERLHLEQQARTDLITAREELLSEQAAREIAARESANKDARKKQMFEIFAARAPGVLDALGKTLGIAKNDQAKISAVIDLANDLDPAVLEGLVSAGLVSDKQRALIETILGKKIKTTTDTTAEAPTETHGENQ